ncbi:hypothetical protein CA14_004161 [Aspergillus flavus]|uniref:Aldehyde dehydrogenase domain-containing protein n=1 Tax=Aspergillus flavus TaxID=5059 RepID=A0AB74CC15_ASPFL|nr:hypothetical protein CA14_004161 [Aspergillus flavus]
MAYGRTGMHSCQPSLLQSGVYTKFLSMLVNTTKKIQVGHDGGIVPCGGKTLTNLPGNLFAPTIISGMIPSMLTSQEEIFGPPLGLYRFETEEEAVQMANDTSMGLASYFFTKDISLT